MRQAGARGSLWAGIIMAMLTASAAAAEESSLYERLGGEEAIRAVVHDFVARAGVNPSVNFTRKGTGQEWSATPENLDKLKAHLVQFISVAAGGPQAYEGRNMRATHAGMHITNAEFDALATDLRTSLETLHVPADERDELLAVVSTTRSDIVEAH